jgi:hypothetical protein
VKVVERHLLVYLLMMLICVAVDWEGCSAASFSLPIVVDGMVLVLR